MDKRVKQNSKYRVVIPTWWEEYTTVPVHVCPWEIPLYEAIDDAEDDFYSSGATEMLGVGTVFTIISSSGNMTKVRTETGMEGWIRTHVIKECDLMGS